MQQKIPKVSVIIPNYNRMDLLPRAVDSVLKQTYSNYELIIVDDGSTDNSRQVIDSFRDDRIRRLYHEKNQGQNSARNTGIYSAKGEYLAFLDSDDQWLPNKLEKQVGKLDSCGPEYGIVFCGGLRIRTKGNQEYVFDETHPEIEGDISEDVFEGLSGRVNFIGSVVKTHLAIKVGGFDKNLKSCEDWDFIIRLCQQCLVTSVRDVLDKYYYHQGEKISKNLRVLIEGTEAFVSKHYDRLIRHPRAFGIRYLDLSRYYLLVGQNNKAIHCMVNAIRILPFRLKVGVIPWIMAALLGRKISSKIIEIRRAWRDKTVE